MLGWLFLVLGKFMHLYGDLSNLHGVLGNGTSSVATLDHCHLQTSAPAEPKVPVTKQSVPW